jgi:hypothetical protein
MKDFIKNIFKKFSRWRWRYHITVLIGFVLFGYASKINMSTNNVPTIFILIPWFIMAIAIIANIISFFKDGE